MSNNKKEISYSTKYCLACAFFSGLYGGSFHILNNLTMFSMGSMAIVAFAILLPVIVAVFGTCLLLDKLGLRREKYAFSAFLVMVWLLVILHTSIKEIPVLQEVWQSTNNLVRLVLFFLIPSAVIGWLFKKDILKLATVLVVMFISAIWINYGQLNSRVQQHDLFLPKETAMASTWFNPTSKPNIYYILADGLTSFRHLGDIGLDINLHKEYLESKSFTTYDDTYSNIHPTPLAMASILNFRLVERNNFEWARAAVANPIELKENLTQAGYRLEYIHGADYLLLRGCAADECFPALDALSQARAMASRIQGKKLIKDNWEYYVGDKPFLSKIESSIRAHSEPTFRYIHRYYPAHTHHDVRGNCDRDEQTLLYLERVQNEFERLKEIINTIIENDPSAVIILSGDHGPWISDNCAWEGVPDTIDGLRDRLGAMVAVRWPSNYQGDFDDDMFSTVNLLKYVMFSLNAQDGPPPHLEPENLYVLDKKNIPIPIVMDKNFSKFSQ